jgi:alpha-ketoglutarate-dependent taurine dioxygenase
MKLETLDALNDNELQAVIARSEELLKNRDDDRKAKALSEARALLASVGLSFKDVAGSKAAKHVKPSANRCGQVYQHPTNKTLVWNAKGQKPGWLRELEVHGGKAIELSLANDDAPAPTKKTG